jgi:hypothetical protein
MCDLGTLVFSHHFHYLNLLTELVNKFVFHYSFNFKVLNSIVLYRFCIVLVEMVRFDCCLLPFNHLIHSLFDLDCCQSFNERTQSSS